MTKAVFIVRNGTLVPFDDEARDMLSRLSQGKEIMVDAKGARNPRQHRLFFALLNLVVENGNEFCNVEQALTAVKIGIGEADPVIDRHSGKTFWTTRSIAFESCDQARFSRIFDRALHLIVTRWLCGTDAEELRRRVFELVDGPAAIGTRAA